MVATKSKWTDDEIDRLRYRCRQARLRNNLQQRDIAERLNWSPNTVGNFERGQNTPTPANLGRLAVLVDELLETAQIAEEGFRPGARAAESTTHGDHLHDDMNGGEPQMVGTGNSKESDWRLLLKAHKSGRPELVEELSTLFERKETIDLERQRIEHSIRAVAKKLQGWAIGLSAFNLAIWLV